MKNYKYVAEIPARIGSQRVKQKNLRLINNKPMIAYSIEACLKSEFIDEIYVNTDNNKIGQVAIDYNVQYYERNPELCKNHVKQDEFNYDFLKSIDCEAVVMVNPVAPLVEASDIDSAIQYYEENDFDTLITVKNERLHSFYSGEPLNFCKEELLPATQDIEPVQVCTWTISIWDKEKFIESYEKKGFAALNGKVGLWPIDPIKAVKVSYEEDFLMAEQLIKAREMSTNSTEKKYYGES